MSISYENGADLSALEPDEFKRIDSKALTDALSKTLAEFLGRTEKGLPFIVLVPVVEDSKTTGTACLTNMGEGMAQALILMTAEAALVDAHVGFLGLDEALARVLGPVVKH